MKVSTFALIAIAAAGVVVLLRRHVRDHDRHADARDLEYELWVDVSSSPPPPPSEFAKLRALYDGLAIRRAIIEIIAANPDQLTLALLKRVLYLRAQALHGEAA